MKRFVAFLLFLAFILVFFLSLYLAPLLAVGLVVVVLWFGGSFAGSDEL